MNMNFTFLSENVHNTTIVDGSTNEVLVEVSTLFGPGRNTTTITNTDGDAIGVYERNWRSDKVILRGHTMNLHEWMPKIGVYNSCSSHKLNAPDGKLYVWKRRDASDSLKLVEHSTLETVAKAHNAGPGKDGRRMNVDFKATLAPIFDALVLSFIICEERRREAARERHDHAASAHDFALAANNASMAIAMANLNAANASALAASANASALATSASMNAACMGPPPSSGPGC